jgi:hypothetical protein
MGIISGDMARISRDEGSILDRTFFDRQFKDILLTADFLPDQRQFLVLNLVIPENTRSWIDPESFRESQKISETKYGHLLVVQSRADNPYIG